MDINPLQRGQEAEENSKTKIQNEIKIESDIQNF